MVDGGYRQGSLSAEVFATLAQQPGAYVSLTALKALFPGKTALDSILGRMVKRGLVCQNRLGYRLTQMQPPPASNWRVPEPLPEEHRARLDELVRRAHAWRAQGLVNSAADLLRDAAARLSWHPAAQDVAALADLFEHAPSLYPVLDLPQRAAA